MSAGVVYPFITDKYLLGQIRLPKDAPRFLRLTKTPVPMLVAEVSDYVEKVPVGYEEFERETLKFRLIQTPLPGSVTGTLDGLHEASVEVYLSTYFINLLRKGEKLWVDHQLQKFQPWLFTYGTREQRS